MSKALFLDDERNVKDVTWLKYPSVDWVVARDYTEFLAKLQEQKFSFISMDHDLGVGKTGYDCLKAMIEGCEAAGVQIPLCVFHTQNPVGKRNMEQTFLNYVEYAAKSGRVYAS